MIKKTYTSALDREGGPVSSVSKQRMGEQTGDAGSEVIVKVRRRPYTEALEWL